MTYRWGIWKAAGVDCTVHNMALTRLRGWSCKQMQSGSKAKLMTGAAKPLHQPLPCSVSKLTVKKEHHHLFCPVLNPASLSSWLEKTARNHKIVPSPPLHSDCLKSFQALMWNTWEERHSQFTLKRYSSWGENTWKGNLRDRKLG